MLYSHSSLTEDSNLQNSGITTSKEIERRYLCKRSLLKLTGDSEKLKQIQLGSGNAEIILGEFLSLLTLPHYARLGRYYHDEICNLTEVLKPDNNIKMRVRKYGKSHGKITVKVRHGIQNGFKVYTEKDILISAGLVEVFFIDIGAGITPVQKRRYRLQGPDGKGWDIDLYEEENSGHLTAEMEADSTYDTFKKPRGIGREITTDRFWKPLLSTGGLQLKPISTWEQSVRNRLFALLN